MLTWPSPPMTTCPPLRTIRIVVARHPGERAAVSSVIGALSSIFRQAPDVWARAQPRKSGDPWRLEAAARAFGRLCQVNASTQIGFVQARRPGPSMTTMRNHLTGGGSLQAHFLASANSI